MKKSISSIHPFPSTNSLDGSVLITACNCCAPETLERRAGSGWYGRPLHSPKATCVPILSISLHPRPWPSLSNILSTLFGIGFTNNQMWDDIAGTTIAISFSIAIDTIVPGEMEYWCYKVVIVPLPFSFWETTSIRTYFFSVIENYLFVCTFNK